MQGRITVRPREFPWGTYRANGVPYKLGSRQVSRLLNRHAAAFTQIRIIFYNFLPPPKSSPASSVDLTLIQDGRPVCKALDLDNLENRGL